MEAPQNVSAWKIGACEAEVEGVSCGEDEGVEGGQRSEGGARRMHCAQDDEVRQAWERGGSQHCLEPDFKQLQPGQALE